MSIGVVMDACTFSDDFSSGTVVIESNETRDFAKAFAELSEGAAARNMASRYATTKGMSSVRLNGNTVGPYPVNAEGVSLEELRDEGHKPIPQSDPRMKPVRYRIDVPVCRSFG